MDVFLSIIFYAVLVLGFLTALSLVMFAGARFLVGTSADRTE